MKATNPEAKAQVKKRSTVSSSENIQAKVEVSKGVVIALGTAPALIGIWAAACFVGGLVASGGPIGMVKSWFSAISGM
ncbi:MAG: hypothetical protein BM485_04645 [Desulfobulbaceae bacterium DB1]|nr:MAG: hypothetical protein BM485_04645 [Desulfobulbaceae bacterium DB1]